MQRGRNKPKTVGRPAKIEIGEALKLRLVNKLSYGQIAKLMGVTKQSVEARLSKLLRLLENFGLIEDYENLRGNILTSAEMELLYRLLDPAKLEKAGLGEISRAFAQIAAQRRLNSGQSTQNIGVAIRLEDLVARKEKMEKAILARGVPHHLVAQEIAKELAAKKPEIEAAEGVKETMALIRADKLL